MAREAAAIYVDDSAIRVVGLSGKRPKQWAIEPLEAGLVRDGLVIDEVAVADRIKALWSAQHMGVHRVIAGISGINSLYRFITLPELPLNLLDEAVSREAGRAFGMPIDQLYISWQALPSKPGETLVYVVASSKTTVDRLVRTLRRAGLNPHVMDVAPLAICRATAETNALIVDLQAATLDVIVKMDGLPEVIRSIAVPSANSASANVTIAHQELQRAMTFYNSGHPDKPVLDEIPILVAGQLADEPELWPGLLGQVQRPIAVAKSPIEAPDGFASHSYLPAIGLALKDSSGKATPYSRVNFNALPAVYRPKPRPMSELLYPPMLVASITCLVLGGYILFNTINLTEALENEATVTGELATSLGAQLSGRRQLLQDEQAALTIETADKEARTATLEEELHSYETTKDEVNGDLGEILETPAGIDLNTVNHSSSDIHVSGWGGTEAAVFSYARQLRSSGLFDHVIITNMFMSGIETAFNLVLYMD